MARVFTILAQSFSCSCSNLMVLEPWGYLSWSQSILPCAHNTCWNSTFSDTRWFGLFLYKKDSPLELHCMVFMWLVIRWRNWVWESFSEKVIHSLAWNDYFKFRFFPFSLTGEALATYPQIKFIIGNRWTLSRTYFTDRIDHHFSYFSGSASYSGFPIITFSDVSNV